MLYSCTIVLGAKEVILVLSKCNPFTKFQNSEHSPVLLKVHVSYIVKVRE